MFLPSKRTSRRAVLSAAGAASLLVSRGNSLVSAQPETPYLETLAFLPGIDDEPMIRVSQMTISPGQRWGGGFGGRSSLMVRSGTLTAPITVDKDLVQLYSGPTLSGTYGMPASYTQDAIHPPDLLPYQGIVTEDGDFGELQNNSTEDVVVIVMVTSQH